MILSDPRNPTAQAHRRELEARFPDGVGDDIMLVIGGDGFMLHCIAEHGHEHTYVGLNAGRVGFLLNDVDCWDRISDLLQKRAWTTYAFPILEADVTYKDGTKVRSHAINDFALERSSGQTAHLRIQVDGCTIVDRLVADGVVIATALGSTAYTYSAGGPACHPTLPILAMTAICPHHPRLAPVILPESSQILVEVLDVDKRPVRGVNDGRTADGAIHATIRIIPERVHFAWLEGHDLTTRMVRKIMRS
jgi:NAD+ kinase